MPYFQGEGCSNAQAQDEDKKVSNGENDDSDDEFHNDSGYLEEWKEHDGIVFGVNGNLHVRSLDKNSASFIYSLKDNMVTVVEGDYVKFVENVKWNHTAKVTKIVSFEGGDKAPFQPTDRSQGPLDSLNYIDEVVKKAAHLYEGHHNKAIDVEFAISEEMKGCREDLRDLQTFTIDCESTLDMDDGFSVEKTDDGVIVFIHITDVQEFVKPDSFLDKIAQKRGATMYLGSNVFNMLGDDATEKLALAADEDRLAFTVKVPIKKEGTRGEATICQSVIRSNGRLSYSFVDAVLNSDDAPEPTLYKCSLQECVEKLLLLDGVINEAQEVDFSQNNTVEFQSPDVKTETDVNGKVKIRVTEFSRAMDIISYLMTLANISVGKKLKSCPDLHPLLCAQRGTADEFNKRLESLRKWDISVGTTKQSCMEFLRHSEKNDTYRFALNYLRNSFGRMEMVFSMTEDDSLFTLRNTYTYAPFTSPIRKYSNLIVQRQLVSVLKEELAVNYDDLPFLLEQLSEKQMNARFLEENFFCAAIAELEQNKKLEAVALNSEEAVLSKYGKKSKLVSEIAESDASSGCGFNCGFTKGFKAGDVVSVNIGWKNESLELKTLSSDPISTVVKLENPFSSSFTPFVSFTAESSWPSSGNFTEEVNNFYAQNH